MLVGVTVGKEITSAVGNSVGVDGSVVDVDGGVGVDAQAAMKKTAAMSPIVRQKDFAISSFSGSNSN